jgi:hypothetical protein
MIVIPMAGLSRRFSDAGYKRPKYMLDLHGRTVFYRAIDSFRKYFKDTPFIFVALEVPGITQFIESECASLGVADARVVTLDSATAGQAETVERGIDRCGLMDDEPLTVFNIDTFRPGFEFPAGSWVTHSAGYLEVFRGAGANWSYVRPAADVEPRVLETAEKRPISDLCCTGLYHFSASGYFRSALACERNAPSSHELYVAPLYNHLITSGLAIHYNLIEASAVLFCGVPAEYEALCDTSEGRWR